MPLISQGEAASMVILAAVGSSSADAERFSQGVGDYERMLDVAMYALECLAGGDARPLHAALRAAELVLRDGDVPARELVEFGLIEELCNTNVWPPGVDGAGVLAELGPLARLAKCAQQLATTLQSPGPAPSAPQGPVWLGDIWLRGPLAPHHEGQRGPLPEAKLPEAGGAR